MGASGAIPQTLLSFFLETAHPLAYHLPRGMPTTRCLANVSRLLVGADQEEGVEKWGLEG